MIRLGELLDLLSEEYTTFNLTRIDESNNREIILQNATQENIVKYTVDEEHIDDEVKMVYNDDHTINIYI